MMKKRAVGDCTFNIDHEQIVRHSKSGDVQLPWKEVLRAHRLSQAYLIEKDGGGMPLPYRSFTLAQREAFEGVLLENAVATVGMPSEARPHAGAAHKSKAMPPAYLRSPRTRGYHPGMQVVSGTIVDGKVVAEGHSLPDGTAVTILARGDEASVKLSPGEQAELLVALDEANLEEGVSADEFLARLHRFG